MKELKQFFLSILLSVAIYTLLTIPHASLIFFNVGFEYPLWLLILLGLISGLLSVRIVIIKI